MKSRHEELAAEEQKRERNWDPQLRWKVLQEMIAWVDAQQPIPRAGSGDDIAHMAVFLASDESSFVTGQDIIVDGGQISGRLWTPQQEGLRQLKQAFGLPAEG